MAIPFVHHFLSRLRDLQVQAKSRQSIPIINDCRRDLELMINIIKIVHNGISINIIVYRRPTHIYHSDSCPADLGGYSNSGFAWRYYLKQEHQFRATNNLLEHIAAIITPWLDIIWGPLHLGSCALPMTNSTTSEGWLRKTNFSKFKKDPIQATVRLEVARMHATHYIMHCIRDSQWFPGEANIIANSLSHNDDRNLFCMRCPSQIPEHFVIQPLPNKITSWLTALLLRLPVKLQLQEKHTRTKLRRGHDGQPTVAGLDSQTHSSTTSHATHESNSSGPSPWLCREPIFKIISCQNG
jgi:hypothetical protein